MFLEEKKQGEVTTKLKLSEAIRKGLPLIQEDMANWRFCALGAAFAGVHGRVMTNEESTRFVFACLRGKLTTSVIADELGFDSKLCAQVNNMHCLGKSASAIADWLDSEGY